MILPIWQPRFASTHLLAQSCGEKLQQPTTHTGTLDPLAEGVVVLLTGEDRFAKGLLTDWDKTYQFSILWGVSTDSLDILGLPIRIGSKHTPNQTELEAAFNAFPEKYSQSIPHFSARRFKGESSFELKNPPPDKQRSITITNKITFGIDQLDQQDLLQSHRQIINQVRGNFRQKEILSAWQQLFGSQHLILSHHQLSCSTGTYIRQFVADLASKLNCPATTWSITRIKNGPYEKQDCVALEELATLI